MRARALSSCIVVFAALACTACAGAPRDTAPSRPEWLPRSQDVEVRADAMGDEGWARVARDVPGGFAGMFVDSTDATRLVVLMVEPERWPEVRDALARHPDLAGHAADPRFRDARVAPARWSFAELYAASRYLMGRVGEWTSHDIDEVRNRVSVGVRTEEARTAMRQRLTELGAPSDLVATDLVGPICTGELRPAIVLHVRDSVTGAPLGAGTWVRIRYGTHVDSVQGPPAAADHPFWLGPDAPGRYDLDVRRAGYRDWQARGVEVPGNECHATTVTLTARLQRLP